MRRSSRRSTMGISIHNSLDFQSNRVNTRRSSSILPLPDEPRNLVGNFTTKFSMSSFIKKVEELTKNQRNAIERVGFGHLLRVHHHTLRKNLLVEWMERWDSQKRAFVLHERELTITDIDAALILGLRTVGKPVRLSEDDPLTELEMEYGVTKNNRKVSIAAIERKLQSLGDTANDEFVRTFLMFVFGTLLFPSSNAKLDSRYLSLLIDVDSVSKYAWGKAVVEELFNWLSKKKDDQSKSMEGCLLLLQVWSYEHVDIGRPNLLSSKVDFPRACRWESSRCNSPRHWFSTKFDELQENQVLWRLQPTAAEMNIDVVGELLMEEGQEAMGEEILSTRTNTTGVPSKQSFNQDAILDEKPEGGLGRGKHELEVDIPEDSGRSIVIMSRTEETGSQEALSSRTVSTSSVKIGLPPKSSSRHAILDKDPDRGMGRNTLDSQGDILEDPRRSTDVSGITEDYTECSSSYGMQEDQFATTSHCLMGESVSEIEKKKSNDVLELKREISMLRNALIPDFEKVIAHLRKEVAELKEDNQRLRASSPADDVVRLNETLRKEVSDLTEEIVRLRASPPVDNTARLIENLRSEVADLREDNERLRSPPLADRIDRLLDAYFNEVADPSEVI